MKNLRIVNLYRNAAKIVKNLAKDSLLQAKSADLFAIAGSLAFTTILAIVPLLAVLFYIFKALGFFEYGYEKLMPFLLKFLSEGSGEIVQKHLLTFISQVHAHAVGWAGFAGLLITTVMTYFTIHQAFNRIWQTKMRKPFLQRLGRALMLLTLGPILLSASIIVTATVATQVRAIPYSSQILAYLLSTIVFSMVYALVPMVNIPYRIVFLGSLISATLLELAKFGYAFYTSKMVSYSAFYGSFAAIPLFLLWIYISWCITLFGAVWIHTLQLHFNGENE